MRAGALGFVHHRTFFGAVIRLGERMRGFTEGHGNSWPHGPAYWNHVFVCTGRDDQIVEAMDPQGVVHGYVSEYADPSLATYTIVEDWPRIDESCPHFIGRAPSADLSKGECVALWCEGKVGTEYGNNSILRETIWCLTGLRLGFNDRDSLICSQLANGGLRHVGINVESKAPIITPSDLWVWATKA